MSLDILLQYVIIDCKFIACLLFPIEFIKMSIRCIYSVITMPPYSISILGNFLYSVGECCDYNNMMRWFPPACMRNCQSQIWISDCVRVGANLK